jgi:uncharacterized repeat protein (TIGR02059 family)
MNHIYRTVWNEISRSFVAVAETVKSHGKRSSSKGCTVSAEENVTTARQARRGLVTSRPSLMRLEPRLVFDGAAVDTAVAIDTHAQEQQAPAADTTVTVESKSVTAQPVTTSDTREAITAIEGAAPYTALLLTAADPAQRSGRVEIAFVEDNVVGWQTITADIPAGIEIVKLDSRGNGLQQMADYLAGRDDIDAIHIFSHGSDGLIKLGTAQVANDTLANYAEPLNQIGSALDEQGDILLYGCNIAKSDAGAALVTSLAALTQAEVAASNDNTGNAARGGDWSLEVKTGNLDQEGLALSSFDGLLVAPNLQKITANGKTLTLTYDQELDWMSTPYAEDFRVDIAFRGIHYIVGKDTTADATDDMVTVDGNNVYLTLDTEMDPEDADRVTVSYTPGVNRIQVSGADVAAAFSNESAQVMSAGASSNTGNLWVNVLHDGAIVIDRFDGTNWNTQFYDNDYQLSDSQTNSSYFQTSSGSLIEFTSGGVTQTIALGSYLNQTGVTRVAASPVQSKNYNDLLTTWTDGDLEITQKVTLPSDTAQQINIQWSARNTGTAEIINLRFVHAVDSYLSGGDNGAGEWDAATNTISVYRTDAGLMQRMSLQGVTVPYSAESQDYDTVATDAIAGFGATPVVDVTIADWDSDNSTPNSYPDNGYGMEWKTATLAAGQSWTIDAVESFVAATAIVTGGDTAAVVTDGTPLTLDFTVENAATAVTTPTYSLEGIPSGWTFELRDSSNAPLFSSSSPIQNASETILASGSSTLHLIVTPTDYERAGTTTITLKATTTAGQVYVSQGTATITVPNHAPVLSAEVLPADEIPAITYAAANEVTGGDPSWSGLNPTPQGYDNATRVVTGPWAKDTNGAPGPNSSCYFTAESGTILANVAYTNFNENSLGVYLTSSGAAANTGGNGTFTLTFVEPSKDLSIRCFYSINTHFTAEVLGVDGTTVLQTINQSEPNSDSNVWLHINRPTAEVGAIRFTAERAAGTDGSMQGTWGVGVHSVIRQPITVNPLVLADIAEDDAPSNGTQISSLLPDSRLYDRDGANPAVGISAVDNTHGTWEYKLNSSSTWAAFDFSANSGKALLLGQNDSVRFISNAEFSGTVSDGLTVHAWDQSAGTAGSYLTIAGNTGGDKTLSVATGTASILVTPVNDAPTINGLATGSTSNAASFTEVAGTDDGTAAVSFTDGTTVITDNDSATLSSLTVSIDSSAVVAGDELKLGSDLIDLTDTSVTGDVTYGTTVFAYAVGDNNTARTITFTVSSGSGAKADFQLLLNALSYNHSGDAPVDASTRTFSILVTDDQGASGPYGTPSGYPAATGANDPFGGAAIFDNTPSPTLVDVDGDGLLDVLAGVTTSTYDNSTSSYISDSSIHYFRNTGTAQAPTYVEQTGANSPFSGLTNLINDPTAFLVDLDGDDVLDLVVGGTKQTAPIWRSYNDSTYSYDIFTSDPNNNYDGPYTDDFAGLQFFLNTAASAGATPIFVEQTGGSDPFAGIQFSSSGQESREARPILADFDGDNDLDMAVGFYDAYNDYGYIKYFENTGSTTAAVFTERTGNSNPFDAIEASDAPALNLIDVGGDGKLDVMFVDDIDVVTSVADNYGGFYNDYSSKTTVRYLKNETQFDANGNLIGSVTFTEVTGANNPFNSMTELSGSNAAIADLNGDDELDLIVGSFDRSTRSDLLTLNQKTDAIAYDFTVTLVETVDPPPDITAPTLASSTPADNATAVAIGSDIVLTFSENVTAVTGKNVVIYKTSDNSVVGTIDAADAQISITNGVVTINPTADLDGSTEYYVLVDAGAFKDAANNDYAGISSTTALSFTTAAALDTTAPAFTSATVTGNILSLTYGEALAGTLPAASAFNISMNGVANAVTGVTIDSNDPTKLNLTLTKAVAFGKTLTVGYTNPAVDNTVATNAAIQDAVGNDAANFSNVTLSSSTTATTSFTMTSVVQPGRAVTISAPNGLSINEVTNTAAPSTLPKTVKLPLGQFGFEISGVAVGGTANLSMELDANLKSLAYYKQNLITGKWDNIATGASVNTGTGKATVNFSLVDGGAYDADRIANGVIVDPGGAGENSLLPYVLENTTDVGTVVLVNTNQVNGTITYELTGGDDQVNFRIDPNTGALVFVGAPNFEAPTDTGEGTGNNTYTVQATIRGSNGGSEIQNLVVTVLNVLEAGETPGVSTIPALNPSTPTVIEADNFVPPPPPPPPIFAVEPLPPLELSPTFAEPPPPPPAPALSRPFEDNLPQAGFQPPALTFLVARVTGAAESSGLVVNSPIPDIVLAPGKPINIQVPTDSFINTNAETTVILEARQADGRPLPNWLKFNPATGTFSGTPPAGLQGVVTVRLLARDNQGHEAVQVFKINIGDRSTVPRAELNDKFGKPALAKQFDKQGFAARKAGANDLILAARKLSTMQGNMPAHS